MTKLWAVDIDGTITENGNGIIHLGTMKVLRELAMGENVVVYVTGRSSVEAHILGVFGGTGEMAIGENGGCITLTAQSHIKLGDLEQCRAALNAIVRKVPGVMEKLVFPRMAEVVLERNVDADIIRSVVRSLGLDVCISDSGYAIHINSPGIDKGAGLRELMRQFNIPAHDIIAIGDSHTDIPMFKVAGSSVAVANAPVEVQDAADIVTDNSYGPGVIEAIERLGYGQW